MKIICKVLIQLHGNRAKWTPYCIPNLKMIYIFSIIGRILPSPKFWSPFLKIYNTLYYMYTIKMWDFLFIFCKSFSYFNEIFRINIYNYTYKWIKCYQKKSENFVIIAQQILILLKPVYYSLLKYYFFANISKWEMILKNH